MNTHAEFNYLFNDMVEAIFNDPKNAKLSYDKIWDLVSDGTRRLRDHIEARKEEQEDRRIRDYYFARKKEQEERRLTDNIIPHKTHQLKAERIQYNQMVNSIYTNPANRNLTHDQLWQLICDGKTNIYKQI